MKKNLVRALAFALVLILALGIIPLGALAANSFDIWVERIHYDAETPKLSHYYDFLDAKKYAAGSTIKVSDYNDTLIVGNKMYDFAGFRERYPDVPTYIDSQEQFDEWAKATNVPFYNGNVDIPKDFTSAEGKEFLEKFGLNEYFNVISATYITHQHSLSYWYADDTTHWRECLVCKKFANQGFWEQFMYQNWHSDGDEDRVCDVCGHDIPYHEIDVEEVKGGKITVELDEAPHRKKIVATAEPEDGYKLKKIHFIKVRDNGTEQEITRRKTSTKGTWWTYMPTYDLKVTAEFVKTK